MESVDIRYKDIVLAVANSELSRNEMVTILLLIANELEVDTVSEMARKEGKTPTGIRSSNRYKKFRLGTQLMTIKELKANETK